MIKYLMSLILLFNATLLQANVNEKFSKFVEKYLLEYWELNPERALYEGYYKHDDQISIPSKESREQYLHFIARIEKELMTFQNEKELTISNLTDFYIIKNNLETTKWHLLEFKSYEWDPSQYNIGNTIGFILNSSYKPLEERLLNINKRLLKSVDIYAEAKKNLKLMTNEHTDLAIEQNGGTLNLLDGQLPEQVKKSKLDAKTKTELNKNILNAKKEVKSFIEFLENKKSLKIKPKSFRIGKELYAKKFALQIQSQFSADELYKNALNEKNAIHNKMIGITKALWPKYFPNTALPKVELEAVRILIDKLADKHIDKKQLFSEIDKQIPLLAKFVQDKDLLDQDPTKPLEVRPTPEYQRGVAGASIDSPGPYDSSAKTYYNVSPIDDYSDDDAKSFLREYNHWILQILNIHEAIPGHYTQLLHANKSPSLIKSIFGNGAMIEGWAVYSERMMLENGYGNNEPEMWLMYYKWNLRVVANTILDYSVHNLEMNQQQAINLLVNEAFQERVEAEKKWKRATLSQVQLTSYYSGFSDILHLREMQKKQLGDKFDLKKFHNEFLSYGSAPIPVIAKLMTIVF